MAKKSEFKRAKNQTKAQYIHLCDPGKKPYSKVTVKSMEETVVRCPLCGHTETHHSMQMP